MCEVGVWGWGRAISGFVFWSIFWFSLFSYIFDFLRCGGGVFHFQKEAFQTAFGLLVFTEGVSSFGVTSVITVFALYSPALFCRQ